ncbi:hypothetical protein [Methylogaea oryzae]|uniref:hypothetical protein n=1 Tax=Methylogaea oryzae TaxID=1295382 RepID=UPI00138F5312|nr:hypothetical protein [Methylogaea oryzae]
MFHCAGRFSDVLARVADAGCSCVCIGRVEAAPGLRLRRQAGVEMLGESGYRHF